MIVYNHFKNDSRVLKEAQTLSENGYTVNIFAIWEKGLKKEEKLFHNVFLTRLDFKPLHKKILGQKFFNWLKSLLYGKPKPIKQSDNNNKFTLTKNHFSPKKLSALKFIINLINKSFSYKGFYIDLKKTIYKKVTTIDFVHAHDLNTLPVGYKISKKYNAKIIYDSHELYVYRNKPYKTPKWFEKLEKKIEKKYIKKCDKVITVSNSIVEYLENVYKIPKPVLVMNTPNKLIQETNHNNLNLREVLNIDESSTIVIYSGAISFNRGLDKIIESLVYLPKVDLVLMGMGNAPFKNYLREVAISHKVENQLHYFGPVKPNEVTSYITSANIGVAPIENVCLSYYYCSPNKIFEYIQGGVPVVSSDFPDLKLVVEGNNIGYTFNPNKPEEIANSIKKLIANKSTYNLLKNNVINIKDKYKWENEQTKLIALYTELKNK